MGSTEQHHTLLDDVRKSYEVFIEERNAGLHIQGKSRSSLREAILAICAGVGCPATGQATGLQPTIFVQPPSQKVGFIDTNRHLGDLWKTLREASEDLEAARGGLRIRVNFGTTKGTFSPRNLAEGTTIDVSEELRVWFDKR